MYIFSSHILETHPEFQFPSDNNWHNLSKKKKKNCFGTTTPLQADGFNSKQKSNLYLN